MENALNVFVPVKTLVPFSCATAPPAEEEMVKLLIPLVTTVVFAPGAIRVGGRPGETAAMVNDTSSPSRR